MNKALFLDRDGVINKDFGYVHKKENFVFVDGIFSLVHAANAKGYLVIVITNQAGIGREYYSEDDFLLLTHWMCLEFQHHDARIDDVFYCPFHPVHGIGIYKQDSFLRKPNPGMIIEARQKYTLDLSLSVLVGDSPSDIQAGIAAGIGRKFLLSHEGQSVPGAETIVSLADVTAIL